MAILDNLSLIVYFGNKSIIDRFEPAVTDYIEKNKLEVNKLESFLQRKQFEKAFKIITWKTLLITVAEGAYERGHKNIAHTILRSLEMDIKDKYKNEKKKNEKMDDKIIWGQLGCLEISGEISEILKIDDENFIIYKTISDVFSMPNRFSHGFVTYTHEPRFYCRSVPYKNCNANITH